LNRFILPPLSCPYAVSSLTRSVSYTRNRRSTTFFYNYLICIGIDPTALFIKDDSHTEALKTYLKAALEGIKNDIGQAIDARFKEMDKKN
jgi:hypothetical protein